jgi:hypothetical protein
MFCATALILGTPPFSFGDEEDVRAGSAASSAHEETLKSKGLKKARTKYVLDETGALAVFDRADAKMARLRDTMSAYVRMVENDQAIANLRQEVAARNGRNQQLGILKDTMNAQQNYLPIDRWNNLDRQAFQRAQAEELQNRSIIPRVERQANQLQMQQPSGPQRRQIQQAFEDAQKVCVKSLDEARESMDSVAAVYRKLAADQEVKAALAELNRSAKGALSLGPSDRFKTAQKQLLQALDDLKPDRKSARSKTPRRR